MDCIPYINDLIIEINVLNDIKNNTPCDIEKINNKIKEKEKIIEKCKENLSKLSKGSVEYRLYYKILEGKSASRAVSEIASENYQNDVVPSSEVQIWRIYKKIKNTINFCK